MQYEATPDGQRFLMITRRERAASYLEVVRGFSDVRDLMLK